MNKKESTPNKKELIYEFPFRARRIITSAIVGRFDKLGEVLNDKDSLTIVKAIWDTGSTTTIICPEIVEKLNLEKIDEEDVTHMLGKDKTPVYNVNVFLNKDIVMQRTRAICLPIQNSQYDMIIGMDILSKGIFNLSHKNEKTTLKFEIEGEEKVKFVDPE